MNRARIASLTGPAADALSDEQIMNVVASIWADVQMREVLYGSADFFQERLRHYGQRGYLTAQERQGILRLMFEAAVTIPSRIAALSREADPPPVHPDGRYASPTASDFDDTGHARRP